MIAHITQLLLLQKNVSPNRVLYIFNNHLTSKKSLSRKTHHQLIPIMYLLHTKDTSIFVWISNLYALHYFFILVLNHNRYFVTLFTWFIRQCTITRIYPLSSKLEQVSEMSSIRRYVKDFDEETQIYFIIPFFLSEIAKWCLNPILGEFSKIYNLFFSQNPQHILLCNISSFLAIPNNQFRYKHNHSFHSCSNSRNHLQKKLMITTILHWENVEVNQNFVWFELQMA